MKKNLLLLVVAAGVTATSVQAQQPLASPSVLENITVQFVSPNGKYMVSNPYEDLTVFDLETGQRWDYVAYDEYGDPTGYSYRVGVGNIISDTGVVLASTLMDTNAAYWKNGQWYSLHTEGCVGLSLSNGITPDGSRICGSINLDIAGFTSETMQLPVYWDAEGDGYGAYHLLPCPTLDFTGRAPQTISAVSISADGKTIAGQVHDYSGSVNEPIIYTQNADGEWTYTLPMEKVFRPEGKEWPKFPEDLPPQPEVRDYMTDEQRAAYDQAMTDWAMGGYNPDEYPSEANYMSEDAVEEYNEAVKEWNELATVFNQQIMDFSIAFDEFLAALPLFEYNNCVITPDGKKVASTISILEDPTDLWSAELKYPSRLDIATGEYVTIGDKTNLTVWSVLSDGRITASNPLMDQNLSGYIENESGELVPIYDYINALRPDYGAWMKENMVHMVEVDFDPETFEPIYGEMFVPGTVVVNGDASKILTWTVNTWDFSENAPDCFAYYFDMNATNSVGDIAADTAKATVKAYEVYDVNGRLMLQTADKAAIEGAGLAKGVYLVKAVFTDGESSTEKVAL